MCLILLLTVGVGDVWAATDYSKNESWNFGTTGNSNWTSSDCGSYCGAWGKNKNGSPVVYKSNISNFSAVDFDLYENVTVTIYVTSATNGGTNSYTVKLIDSNGSQVSTYTTTKTDGMGTYSSSASDAEESYVTFNPTQAFSGYRIEFNPKSFITNTRYVLTYDNKAVSCTGDKLVMSTVTATPGDGQVTLNWNTITGATKYQVKWGTGSWTDVNTNSYTKTGLTNGDEYSYQVKAIGNGSTTCDSDPTSSATVKAGLCYTVSFSTGEDNPSVASKKEEEFEGGITLPAGPMPNASGDGWVFAGWGTAEVSNVTVAPRLYMPGDPYYPESNETLYAVYRKLTSGTSTATFTSTNLSNLTQLSSGVTSGAWWIHTATGVEFYIESYGIYNPSSSGNKFDIYSSWALIDAHTKIQQVVFTIYSNNTISSVELNDDEEAAGGTAEISGSSTQTITCTGDVTQLYLYKSSGDAYFSTFTVTYYNAKFHSNPVPCAVDPTVGDIMNAVSAISSTGATFSTSAGVSAGTGCDLTAVGFVYGTATAPTLDNNVASIDNYTSGALNKSITGLEPNTKYYVRAYATNSHGTTYSDEKEFTTLQRYNITYNNNGGSGSISAATKDHGVDFTLPANAGGMSKTGYHIKDWKLNSASGTSYALGGKYTEDAAAEFFAGWEANTYSVVFNANGGQGDAMTPQAFTYDVAQNLSANTYTPAAGSHKYFNGWATSAARANAGTVDYAAGANVSNLTATNTGTYTLYAVWADHTYKNYRTTCCTKYDITAGTPVNGSFTVKEGDNDVDKACEGTTISIVATPASDSYVFKSWSIVDGGDNDVTESLLGENPPASTSFNMPDYAITINAVFDLKTTEFAVTLLDNNGGEHNGSATVSINGTALSNISVPTKTGYHVAGYYLETGCTTLVANAAGTLQASASDITDENGQFIKGEAITLYAGWEANEYTVTISKNYGNASDIQVTATYGNDMPSLSGKSISREGYTLAGIYANNDGTGTKYYNSDKSSAHVWDQATGATIYAAWSPKNYTIILNNEDADTGHEGTASISVTYDSNENLTGTPAIELPEKTGHVFGGYFTNADGEGTQIIDAAGNVIPQAGGGNTYTDASKNWKKAGNDNVNLYAYWRQSYTVTWSVNNSTTTEPVISGEKVAAMPTAPTKSDCDDAKVFVGWRAEKITGTSTTNPGDIFTTVAGSPEITDDVTFYAVFADVTGGEALSLTFPDDNSENNGLTSNQYTSTWTAKTGTFGFTIKNFNNSNWGNAWAYIRCGRKDYASVASISTDAAVPFVVDSVLVEIAATDADKINSAKLYISSESNFSSATEMDIPQSVATQRMVIASSAKDKYYKIEFDCKNKSNGFVQINSVVYKQKIDTSNFVTSCATCTENATFTSTTPAVSEIACTSATVTATGGLATLGSEGCNISDYGFVIGASENPAIDGEGVTKLQVGTTNPTIGADFSYDITGLTASTQYNVRAYAINKFGTAYSSNTSFYTSGVSSIAITTAPTKTNYIVGETFDKTGMTVTATMANGAYEDVTEDVTYSASALTAGENQDFAINYTLCEVGKSANQKINVYTLAVSEGANGDKGVATAPSGATFSVTNLATHYTAEFDITNGTIHDNGDGSYTVINPTGNVTVTVNYVEANPVHVYYQVNGTTITSLSPSGKYQGETVTLPTANELKSAMTAQSMVMSKYGNFAGWSETEFAYQNAEPTLVGGTPTINTDKTFYAVFTNLENRTIGVTDITSSQYPTSEQTLTKDGIDFKYHYILKTSYSSVPHLQFQKKASDYGRLYNHTAMTNLIKIETGFIEHYKDAAPVPVYACSAAGTISGSALTAESRESTDPYVYIFPANTKYFMLKGDNDNVYRPNYITIYYASEDVYYTTQFSTLTFKKADGTDDKSEIIATNKTRTLVAGDAPTEVTGYEFLNKWMDGTNDYVAGDAVTVSTDVTLIPYSRMTTMANEVDIDGLPDGVVDIVVADGKDLNVNDEKALDNLIVEAGGKVSGSSALTVNNLTIQTSLGTISGDDNTGGKSGQITNSNITANGDVFIEIELTQATEASYGWYAFSVPFQVDALNGVYYGETKLTNEVGYAIMKYHEDVRAEGKYAWKKYRETLKPGELYIITVADTDYKTLRFKKITGANLIASNQVQVYKTDHSSDGTDLDEGWNGVGNPNLQISQYTSAAVMQFLDHEANAFKAREASAVNLMVGSAFMLQHDATEKITIAAGNSGSIALAPTREPKSVENVLHEVKLINATTEKEEDNVFFTAREEATNSYEIGHDVAKMSMGTANCAQMMIPAYGTNLCAADFPMVNDKAEYPLNITTPAAGTYRIEAAKDYADADIYLTYNGAIIWNLTMSPYEAELVKGNNAGYGLLLQAKMPMTPTGIENGESLNGANGVQKLIINDHVYILRAGQLFDVTGKAVK